jgi:HIRAN domain
MRKTCSIVGQKFRGLDPYLPGIESGTTITLVREPDNPHDKNAVAVWIGTTHVGYLPSKDNPPIAAYMDSKARTDDASNTMTATFRRSPNSAYPQCEIVLPD